MARLPKILQMLHVTFDVKSRFRANLYEVTVLQDQGFVTDHMNLSTSLADIPTTSYINHSLSLLLSLPSLSSAILVKHLS